MVFRPQLPADGDTGDARLFQQQLERLGIAPADGQTVVEGPVGGGGVVGHLAGRAVVAEVIAHLLGQVGIQCLRLLPLAHLRGDCLPINLLRQGVQLRQPRQGLLAGQPALGRHRDGRPVPAELAEEVAPTHLLERLVHVVY